ncbi:MAG: histidine--tRNA ligase [Minisyncoccia bacterium]
MSGGLPTEPYKGVRDFYPADWGLLSTIFANIRKTLSLRGYEEYQASPLEHSELYESKGNEEIIREQTFSFTDRGGRRVTLRPEMTPTLARMVAGKRRELVFPLRWFSIGNRFRYERPQKGRLREFFQCDVDLIGLSEGEADLEILLLAAELLRAFGATDADFSIRVNSRSLLHAAARASGLPEGDAAREYWKLLDRKEKMPREEFEAARRTGPDPLKAIEEATDREVQKEKQKIETLIETLQKRGVPQVSFDPSIVRGFDYYTGMVFEVYDTHKDNPRALFGGGRYNELVSMFGGDGVCAVGFAFGDVTLVDFLTTHGLLPRAVTAPQVYIGTPTLTDIPRAKLFAASLQEAGIRTFVNLTDKDLGDQVRNAVRRGIPYFLAYGAQEEKSSMVRIKDLARSEEESIEENQVVPFLRRVLG